MSNIREQFLASVNGHHATIPARTVAHRLASQITPEPIHWIWYGFLAQGKLSLLEGNPKLGKSTLTADIIARITTGSPFPGHTERREPRSVVLCSAEDGPADTIVPRLTVAGAELSRVSIATGIRLPDEREAWIGLDKHLDELEAHIREVEASLMIIDPLMAYLGDVNAHKDQDVRAALGPLMAMLDRTGCAALLVRHLNKASGSDIVTRGGGSIGISGAARMGMFVGRHPDDESRRVLAQSLTNLTPEQPSLEFWLESVPGTDVARVVWSDTPAPYNAEDLLTAAQGSEERTERSDAAEWLLDYLREGPVPQRDVIRDAKRDGHSEKTLRRAKKDYGIQAIKEGYGKDGQWVWKDPEAPRTSPRNMATPSYVRNEAILVHHSSSSGHLKETKVATDHKGILSCPPNGHKEPLDALTIPWEDQP